MHRQATGIPQGYDIVSGEITGGTARPYRGDRSVYTSEMDVRINIKDNTAATLYYQQHSYSDGDFAPVGSPMSEAINGASYVDLDKTTLADGAFYAVWTDADSTKEYFEYHVATPQTYELIDGNISFSTSDFWYALLYQSGTTTTESAIVPMLPGGDYREYVNGFALDGTLDGVLFKNGVLGAYTVPLTAVTA